MKTLEFVIDGLSRIHSVARDVEGNFYFTDEFNHRLLKYDAAGRKIFSLGEQGQALGQYQYPCDLAIKDSFLWLCDSWNHRLVKHDLNGNALMSLGSLGNRDGDFTSPTHLAFSADHCFVLDHGNERIQSFNSAFEWQKTFSVSKAQATLDTLDYQAFESRQSQDFPGEMNLPVSLVGDSALTAWHSKSHTMVLFKNQPHFYGTLPGHFNMRVIAVRNWYLLLLERNTNVLYCYDQPTRQLHLLFKLDPSISGFLIDGPDLYGFDGKSLMTWSLEDEIEVVAKNVATCTQIQTNTQMLNLLYDPDPPSSSSVMCDHILKACDLLFDKYKALDLNTVLPNRPLEPLANLYPIDQELPTQQALNLWYLALFEIRDTLRRLVHCEPAGSKVFGDLFKRLWDIGLVFTKHRLSLLLDMKLQYETDTPDEKSILECDLALYLVDQTLFFLQSNMYALVERMKAIESWEVAPFPEHFRNPGYSLYFDILTQLVVTDRIQVEVKQSLLENKSALEAITSSAAYYCSFTVNSLMGGKANKLLATAAFHLLEIKRLWQTADGINCTIHHYPNARLLLEYFAKSNQVKYLHLLLSELEKVKDKDQETYNIHQVIYHGYVLRDYNRAVSFMPATTSSPLLKIMSGMLDALQGNQEQAIATLEGFNNSYFNGIAMQHSLQFDLAYQLLTKGPDVNQSLPEKLLAIRLACLRGDFKRALAHLNNGLSLNSDVHSVYAAVLTYGSRQFQSGLEALEEGSGQAPEMTLFYKGLIYRGLGEYDRAISALDEEYSFYPSWFCQLEKYLCLLAKEDKQSASALLDDLPNFAFLYHTKGMIFKKDEQFEATALEILQAEQIKTEKRTKQQARLFQLHYYLGMTQLLNLEIPPNRFRLNRSPIQ